MKTLLAATLFAVSAASFASAQVQVAGGPTVTTNVKKTCSNATHSIEITFDYLSYGNGDANKIAIVKGYTITGTSVGTVDASFAGQPPLKKNFQAPYQVFVHKASFDKWSVIIDVRNGNNDGDYENAANYSVISGCKLVD